MRKTLLAIVITIISAISISWTICDIEPRTKFELHGTIYEWHYYAGSNDSITRRLKGFFPVATTLYVRRVNWGYRGIMPICDTLVSDSSGYFTTVLEEGEYNVFEEWQLEPLIMPQDSAGIVYDTACIRKQYMEPACKLNIMSDNSLEVTYFPRDVKNRRCLQK